SPTPATVAAQLCQPSLPATDAGSPKGKSRPITTSPAAAIHEARPARQPSRSAPNRSAARKHSWMTSGCAPCPAASQIDRPARCAPLKSMPTKRVAALLRADSGDGLDLDEDARRQRDADGRPGREARVEMSAVDLVERPEVAEVAEEAGGLHDPVEAGAGRLEDLA